MKFGILKRIFDFAGMGISSCALGYSDDYVDNSVKAISNGSMGTLILTKEVDLVKTYINSSVG